MAIFSWTKNAVSPAMLSEAKALAIMTWPILVGYFLLQTLGMASMFVLGHVGTKELAASALTTMFCNVTGFSIGIGMHTAMDTLCSQAFTGSRDRHALGKHLQRSLVVDVMLSIPIACVWMYTREILLVMGQNEDIAALSGVFARWMLPGLLPNLVADSARRYLQAQGIMVASMIAIMVAAPVNIFLQWFLVWSPQYGIGVIGSPIATSISNMLICGMTVGYIVFVKGHEVWGGWDLKELFNVRKLWEYVKLGTPGVLMICSEWWAFEILALACGLLGDTQLAAQSIILSTVAMTYILPMSLGIASSTRIGNALGAQRPQSARRSIRAAYILGSMLTTVNVVFLVSVRNTWGLLFTEDSSVVRLVAQTIPVAALFHTCDGLAAISGGALRGCGRQHIGGYVNLIGYYMIGLPLSFYTGFYLEWGFVGIWTGIAVAVTLVSVTLGSFVARTDWEKESEKAAERVGDSPLGEEEIDVEGGAGGDHEEEDALLDNYE